MPPTNFFDQIKKFNKMYNMPENGKFDLVGRLENFHLIVDEELEEINDILDKANGPSMGELSNEYTESELKVDVADLLGDIIVYCASEAERWGIPIDKVLNIIMESNFSKLDENGNPIYDERGKLLKGPNYWKPEAKIKKLLEQ